MGGDFEVKKHLGRKYLLLVYFVKLWKHTQNLTVLTAILIFGICLTSISCSSEFGSRNCWLSWSTNNLTQKCQVWNSVVTSAVMESKNDKPSHPRIFIVSALLSQKRSYKPVLFWVYEQTRADEIGRAIPKQKRGNQSRKLRLRTLMRVWFEKSGKIQTSLSLKRRLFSLYLIAYKMNHD